MKLYSSISKETCYEIDLKAVPLNGQLNYELEIIEIIDDVVCLVSGFYKLDHIIEDEFRMKNINDHLCQ